MLKINLIKKYAEKIEEYSLSYGQTITTNDKHAYAPHSQAMGASNQ